MPILIGFTMGPEALGAYMAGVAVSGVLWAIFQNNAGGAWDNAKKSFEEGVMIDGEMTYKGSEAHKAAVTGDVMVGDPFKDTRAFYEYSYQVNLPSRSCYSPDSQRLREWKMQKGMDILSQYKKNQKASKLKPTKKILTKFLLGTKT